MAEVRSPLLDQFERAVVEAERARRLYEHWQDMDRGCNRGKQDCILCRGVDEKRRAYARARARMNRIRGHLVNALEYKLDSARDHRALAPGGWSGGRWEQSEDGR